MGLFGSYIEENDNTILNEVTVKTDFENNYKIIVTPDIHRAEGYFADPYFKLLDSASYTKAGRTVRVFVFNPFYTYHRDDKEKLPWNSRVANYLNELMNSLDDPNDPNSPTVFKKTMINIAKYNDKLQYGSKEYNDYINTRVPNFSSYRLR